MPRRSSSFSGSNGTVVSAAVVPRRSSSFSGSNGTVVSAAVVCLTKRWHMPIWRSAFFRAAFTSLVMSTTSRGLCVLIVRIFIHLFPRNLHFYRPFFLPLNDRHRDLQDAVRVRGLSF